MKDMFDLTGKIAVVTGASSGLGRDAAYAYAEFGADVALLARRYDRLVDLKEKSKKRQVVRLWQSSAMSPTKRKSRPLSMRF